MGTSHKKYYCKTNFTDFIIYKFDKYKIKYIIKLLSYNLIIKLNFMTNQKESSIHLKFIRHGEKDWDNLSEIWKKHASSLDLPNTVAYASDKTRTQLTAYFATNPDIKDFKKTLEDFENNSGKFRKVRINKKLWYDGNAEFYGKAIEAASKWEYSTFVIDSDKYFQDENDSTYTKVAWDFAEIILNYCKIRDYAMDRWRLPKVSKEFNRLFVSHQWVLELIMFKLIEQNEWREWLENFIKENHLEWWVDFCEWIDVYIYKDRIKLKFRNHEYSMDEDFLKNLINERDELYKKNKFVPKNWVDDVM